MGLLLLLALRFMPRGVIPEKIQKKIGAKIGPY